MGIKDFECLTLADIASRSETNKMDITKDIVEMLNKENAIFDDMLWRPGNMGGGHKYIIRTLLPKATWTKLYQGVPHSKSTTAQVTETFGRLETASQIDVRLYDQVKNPTQLRYSEDIACKESLYQSLATAIFYENQSVNEERITGLSPRFNDKTNAKNKVNVLDAGGTSAYNRSIWLVGWGEEGAFGIYPDGDTGVAGLTMKNRKDFTAFDSNNNPYTVDRTEFKWNCGFCLKDWRKVVRIANIDKASLKTAGTVNDTCADLAWFMDKALDSIIAPSNVRLAFYMTRETLSAFKSQIKKKSNIYFTIGEYLGRLRVPSYQGVPIRIVDALDVDETQVQ
jgi:hypothetical protein